MMKERISNIPDILAHDLRGSLVSISATLKLLGSGYYGKMDEPVSVKLEELLKRMNGLIHMYEEWIERDFSSRKGLDREQRGLDLKQDIIDPVLEEFSTEIKDRGIKIDNPLGSIILNRFLMKADKFWLKAVFRNLIKNAIKYGDPGGLLSFGFEDHGVSCQVHIYNSGKPIPEGWRDKLFTKFELKENQVSRRFGGMGIGLYLIKRMIQKNGGDISYEAKENGSDFVLTLPVSSPAT